MSMSYGLSEFLCRRLHRDWASVLLSRGPDLTDTNQIDEVLVDDLAAAFAKREPGAVHADLAAELEGRARADATALRFAGPYYISIRRPDGRPITERFPLTFPDAAPTEADEKRSFLETQRTLAISQTTALTANQALMLEYAKFVASRDDERHERMREDLLRERNNSIALANLVLEGTKAQIEGAHAQVASAKEHAELLLQGDARRREMFVEEQRRVAVTGLLQHADVIVPALASGWMKRNGAGGESLDVVAEFKLIEELMLSLSPDQFNSIGAKLPMTVRMGLMQIHHKQLAPAIVPFAAAKLFAQIDQKLAFEIYADLEPSISVDEPHPGRAMGLDGPCKLCGMSGDTKCLEPSRQQKLWVTLMATKGNTLAARGEQAMKALSGK